MARQILLSHREVQRYGWNVVKLFAVSKAGIPFLVRLLICLLEGSI